MRARRLRLRPGLTPRDLTNAISAATDGVILRAIGDPQSGALDHARRKSLTGLITLAIIYAFVEGEDSVGRDTLEQAVDKHCCPRSPRPGSRAGRRSPAGDGDSLISRRRHARRPDRRSGEVSAGHDSLHGPRRADRSCVRPSWKAVQPSRSDVGEARGGGRAGGRAGRNATFCRTKPLVGTSGRRWRKRRQGQLRAGSNATSRARAAGWRILAPLSWSCTAAIRPYGGTLLVFSDYMRPAVLLAARMQQVCVDGTPWSIQTLFTRWT